MEVMFCFLFFTWMIECNMYMIVNFIMMMLVYLIINMGEGFYFSWEDGLGFSMSSMNYSLILLSCWIIYFMMFSMNLSNLLFSVVMFLMLIIMKCFMSMDLFMFYFFFESSLVPTFFLVLKWGHNKNSIISSYYMLFYTVFFSLPLLIMLFMLMNELDILMFELIDEMELNLIQLLFIIFGMLVKLPVFLMHVWLPKAHVEAPVFGSMVLAALMLKLGGYGLISVVLMFKINNYIYEIMIILLCLSSFYLSMFCLNQVDLKMLIAYSSVVHMGLMCMGIMVFNFIGLIGAQMMMIAHGLCSSGLFYMVYLFYLRSNSRMLMINKGFLSLSSKMMLMWFLLCSSNFSSPISLNLVSEVFLINSVVVWSLMMIIPIMFMSFFSVCYSVYMFIFISHNKGMNIMCFNDKLMEYFIVFMHWFPLNLLIFNMSFF
uniref:NADH-ubiquinone oxidoreductase chain 4 n=1 Tax=Ammophila sabulosa TaxID=1088610 RepID=A0A7L7SAR5_9HYME|nr:NADH dehydrogenase subunit 4 [Ammophila sabulosa]